MSWNVTYLLALGVDAIVEQFTCYGLGTYNTICAGETVECKCTTTTALHLWNIYSLNEICDNDVFYFYAEKNESMAMPAVVDLPLLIMMILTTLLSSLDWMNLNLCLLNV